MKTKFSRILIALLILTLCLVVLVACNTDEQSLDGMYIVTFDFNGGILDNSKARVPEISHAYKPNSLLIDISTYPGYKFTKDGFVFVGWFTKNGIEDDDWGTQWNVKSDRVTKDITLYAKWEKAIVYRFVIYLDVKDKNGDPIELGSYKVAEGEKFDDKFNYGKNISSYDRTFLDFYSDETLETKWDFNTPHPGGEKSFDVPVYVKSMKGVWTFVSTYEQLIANRGKNIWLTANIDCQGKELYLGDYNNTLYGGGFEGDDSVPEGGYSISNFTVKREGTNSVIKYAIFGTLGEKAKIENVQFKDMHISIVTTRTMNELQVAALAISAKDGCQIINVSVSGSYEADLSVISDSTLKTPEQKEAVLAQIQQALANITNALFTQNASIELNTFEAKIEQKQD